jgi:hypothetical protein
MKCLVIAAMSAPCQTCQRYRHGLHRVQRGTDLRFVCLEHCLVCSPKLEHKEATEVKTVRGEQVGLFGDAR